MTEELKLNLMKKFKELNVAEYTTKYGDYYGLMFAGAEIATKEQQEENKELELKVSRLESYCDAYNYSQRTYQEEIKDLKELYKKADENWWNAQQTIEELQEQIEKMKCFKNCLTFNVFKCPAQSDKTIKSCIGCKYWKLKE